MLVRIVKMTLREDTVDYFKHFFESRKEQIRNFEGCHYLELWQDLLHTNVFFTYSHWINADALDHYRNSSFFADTWSQTKQLFAAKPEAWSVNQLAIMP
ncbi:MAG: antibiotic biosynthesis monooxygenase [Segetibacter sp.]|nr:antibiotic biosynthesis monooxygenase [Segetibacter sp.]